VECSLAAIREAINATKSGVRVELGGMSPWLRALKALAKSTLTAAWPMVSERSMDDATPE